MIQRGQEWRSEVLGSKEERVWQTHPIYQNRKRLTDMENRLVVVKGEREGSQMDWVFGVGSCKLLHLEWISNEVLLYSTGNYIQSLVTEHDRRWYEKKNVCICLSIYIICMTELLCYTAEIDTTLSIVNQLYSKQNKIQ